MGLEGSDGELLAGDPIPAAPGATTNKAGTYSGEGNSAIVGDSNLWDGLNYRDDSTTTPTQTTQETTTPTEESSTPEEPSVAVQETNENPSTPSNEETTSQ
jgi:hypothetical protein